MLGLTCKVGRLRQTSVISAKKERKTGEKE